MAAYLPSYHELAQPMSTFRGRRAPSPTPSFFDGGTDRLRLGLRGLENEFVVDLQEQPGVRMELGSSR